MKFTKIWLLTAIFLMGVTGLTQAAVYTWGGGDGNWKVAGNWGPPGGPPNGYDEAIIPSGNVYIDSTQYSVSKLTLGAGAGLHIPKWGLMFDTEAVPHLITVTNNGTIDISPLGTDASGLDAHDCVVTLTGGGEIELGGNLQGGHLGNGGYGGSFINDTDHTIRGGGSLECNVTNKGRIGADNGTLVLNGTITNQGGAISIDQAAAVLRIGGNVIGNPLQINDGTVVLQPGRVSNLTLGPGKVEVRDGCLQGNIVLPSGTQFTVAADKVLYLRQAPDGTSPLII